MSNESKPSGSERLAQVLGEVDMDELEKAIKARMETIKKAGGFHESVDGPDDEMKYILHKDGLPSDRYHELARTITGSSGRKSSESSHSRSSRDR